MIIRKKFQVISGRYLTIITVYTSEPRVARSRASVAKSLYDTLVQIQESHQYFEQRTPH
jgi:hypothetical protein